jgi:hypothetical protein
MQTQGGAQIQKLARAEAAASEHGRRRLLLPLPLAEAV